MTQFYTFSPPVKTRGSLRKTPPHTIASKPATAWKRPPVGRARRGPGAARPHHLGQKVPHADVLLLLQYTSLHLVVTKLRFREGPARMIKRIIMGGNYRHYSFMNLPHSTPHTPVFASSEGAAFFG